MDYDFDDHIEHLSCDYCHEWYTTQHHELIEANQKQAVQIRNLQSTLMGYQEEIRRLKERRWWSFPIGNWLRLKRG